MQDRDRDHRIFQVEVPDHAVKPGALCSGRIWWQCHWDRKYNIMASNQYLDALNGPNSDPPQPSWSPRQHRQFQHVLQKQLTRDFLAPSKANCSIWIRYRYNAWCHDRERPWRHSCNTPWILPARDLGWDRRHDSHFILQLKLSAEPLDKQILGTLHGLEAIPGYQVKRKHRLREQLTKIAIRSNRGQWVWHAPGLLWKDGVHYRHERKQSWLPRSHGWARKAQERDKHLQNYPKIAILCSISEKAS